MPDDLSMTEAAERLGLTRVRVHQFIKAGRLKARKVGNFYVLTVADVDRFKAAERVSGFHGHRAPRKKRAPTGSLSRKNTKGPPRPTE